MFQENAEARSSYQNKDVTFIPLNIIGANILFYRYFILDKNLNLIANKIDKPTDEVIDSRNDKIVDRIQNVRILRLG